MKRNINYGVKRIASCQAYETDWSRCGNYPRKAMAVKVRGDKYPALAVWLCERHAKN